MARSFSKREAGELVARHRQWLRQLDAVRADLTRWQSYTAHTAAKLVSEGVFGAYAQKELSTGRESFSENLELVRLLTELLICRQLTGLIARVERSEGTTLEEIEQSIRALTPALGGFSWTFASAKKKKRAEEAFCFLSALAAGGYPRQVEAAARQAKDAATPEAEEVLRLFCKDRAGFQEALFAAAPGIAWDGPASGALGQLQAAERVLAAELEQCVRAVEKSKKDIEDAAERYVTERTMRTLAGIPVEELRGLKRGLRVKTLRDEGYATMAEVFSAEEARLAAIRGISDDGAALIKRHVGALADEIRSGVTITLNADEPSPEAGAIVTAVYAYRRKAEDRVAFQRLVADGLYAVPGDSEVLAGLGNGAKLLFLRPDARARAYESYRRAVKNRDARLTLRVRELAFGLETESYHSPDEAWECFRRDPEAFFAVLEGLAPGAAEWDED